MGMAALVPEVERRLPDNVLGCRAGGFVAEAGGQADRLPAPTHCRLVVAVLRPQMGLDPVRGGQLTRRGIASSIWMARRLASSAAEALRPLRTRRQAMAARFSPSFRRSPSRYLSAIASWRPRLASARSSTMAHPSA